MATFDADAEVIGVLSEQVRRSLYRYVVSRDAEVSRNEAADALGIQRSLAAFHLDKLAEVGLLDVSYRRLGDRRGPGAGRPAKLYRSARSEVGVHVPPRSYETAAQLFADAVEVLGGDLTLHEVARRRGVELGRDPDDSDHGSTDGDVPDDDSIAAALVSHGYEPYREGDHLRLRNCPFHALAVANPPLVCGMNLALLKGLVEGVGMDERIDAYMDPRPGQCCVAFVSKNNYC